MQAGAVISNIFTTSVLDVFFLYLHNKFVNIIKGINKNWAPREIGGVSLKKNNLLFIVNTLYIQQLFIIV